jgi:uncharacterized protein (DUF952 family)
MNDTSGLSTRKKNTSIHLIRSSRLTCIANLIFRSEQKLEELNIDDQEIKKSLLEELKRRYKRPIIKAMTNFSVFCRSF